MAVKVKVMNGQITAKSRAAATLESRLLMATIRPIMCGCAQFKAININRAA